MPTSFLPPGNSLVPPRQAQNAPICFSSQDSHPQNLPSKVSADGPAFDHFVAPLPDHLTELCLSEGLGVRIKDLFALGLTEDPVQNPVLNAV